MQARILLGAGSFLNRSSMNFRYLLIALFTFSSLQTIAQYAPQVPLPGNKGIAQNSNLFVDWASGCNIQRGWLDIADKSLGQPTAGTIDDAIGVPGNGVLSLGDSGIAVLTFNYNIYNGNGPDFAIFENGFSKPQFDSLAYLELAFVEVSSDGINYFRFPASSAMQDTLQIDNFSYSNTDKYNNLAGKYISGFGTPFDLEELKDTPGLDINHISHVRIVDVVGSINPLYGSFDKDGHIINDPYPTPYASAGFDLTGVGVINSLKPTAIAGINDKLPVSVYPNPTDGNFHIEYNKLYNVDYRLTDLSGKEINKGQFSQQTTLSLSGHSKGIYFLYLQHDNENVTYKIIKK